MKRIPATAELMNVARRIVWFKEPAETLADPIPFLAHVITYGTISDVVTVQDAVDKDAFRDVFCNAPLGIFDARS